MSLNPIRMAQAKQDFPPVREETVLGNWKLSTSTSHILRSTCKCNEFVRCNHCTYEKTLKIPDLPEMTFDRNSLTIVHLASGCKIELCTLDALNLVDHEHDLIKVSYADEWLAKRHDNEDIKNTPKPFDWTFTTYYNGSMINSKTHRLVPSESVQEPDQEKLLRRDRILYHTEFVMFEDELADNGSSKLTVKCRVMPTFILILMRFYLRVDKVMIRVQETRLYCEINWNYLLRDVTLRESSFEDLSHLSTAQLFDEWSINKHLPVVKRDVSRIEVVKDN